MNEAFQASNDRSVLRPNSEGLSRNLANCRLSFGAFKILVEVINQQAR